jgi:hypothetical protein
MTMRVGYHKTVISFGSRAVDALWAAEYLGNCQRMPSGQRGVVDG